MTLIWAYRQLQNKHHFDRILQGVFMDEKSKANFYLEHPISLEEAQAMPPMSLAFIGDSVP